MHHQSDAINDQLAELEETYVETGDVTAQPEERAAVGATPMERATKKEGPGRGPRDAPF